MGGEGCAERLKSTIYKVRMTADFVEDKKNRQLKM